MNLYPISSLINEIHDPVVDDLFSNPENKSLSLRSIISAFEEKGGSLLGQGSFGIVITHPHWKYALKIFHDDPVYLKYVRFAKQNPKPSFPVFYDIPRKIKNPEFAKYSHQKNFYVVKMEKLNRIDKLDFSYLKSYIVLIETLAELDEYFPALIARKKNLEELDVHFKQFGTDLTFLLQFFPMSPHIKKDLSRHSGNIMRRQNGEYVIIDPFVDEKALGFEL